MYPQEINNEMIERHIKYSEENEPVSAETLLAIEEGLLDIRNGRTIPMEDVMKDLGIE